MALRCGRAAGLSSAAVFKKEAAQRLHQSGVRTVDQVSALSLDQQQTGARELFQMEAQRGIRYAQLLNELGRSQTGVPALHDQPEDIQTRFLPEREKGGNRILIIHISNYMEIYDKLMTSDGQLSYGLHQDQSEASWSLQKR